MNKQEPAPQENELAAELVEMAKRWAVNFVLMPTLAAAIYAIVVYIRTDGFNLLYTLTIYALGALAMCVFPVKRRD